MERWRLDKIDNDQIRRSIVNSFDADIICISETHLKDDDVLQLSGYKYFDCKRTKIHINAPKGSGGVGCFVRNSVLADGSGH